MKRTATAPAPPDVDWLHGAVLEVKDTLADFAKRFPDKVEIHEGKLRLKR